MGDVLARSFGGIIAAVSLLGGCSSAGRAFEQLDERSGITIVRGAAPLVFARTEPRYSRSARDYVYLGPVETNRQGVREYYLWVGIATTLDRGFLAPKAETPDMLYVEIGGEPMELPLRPWHELVATRFSKPMYATAVAVRQELAARVTLQQLTRIDAEPLPRVAVGVAADAVPRPYVRWHDDGGFDDFLGEVAGSVAGSLQ
jgi:hypothetical protein